MKKIMGCMLAFVLAGLSMARACESAAEGAPVVAASRPVSLEDKVDLCGLLFEYIMVMKLAASEDLPHANMLNLWLLAFDAEEKDEDIRKILSFVTLQPLPDVRSGIIDWKARVEMAEKTKRLLVCYFKKYYESFSEPIQARLEVYLSRVQIIFSTKRVFACRSDQGEGNGVSNMCSAAYKAVRTAGYTTFDFVRYAMLCLWCVGSRVPDSCASSEVLDESVLFLQKHFSQILCDVPLFISPEMFYMSRPWQLARSELFDTTWFRVLLQRAVTESAKSNEVGMASFCSMAAGLCGDAAVAGSLDVQNFLLGSLEKITGEKLERAYEKPLNRRSKEEQARLCAKASAEAKAHLAAFAIEKKRWAQRFLVAVLPRFRDFCRIHIKGYDDFSLESPGAAGAGSSPSDRDA